MSAPTVINDEYDIVIAGSGTAASHDVQQPRVVHPASELLEPPRTRLTHLMGYARLSASDYDDWETMYQNPGWGSKDLIPLREKGISRLTRFLVWGPLTVLLQSRQKPDDADTHGLETINVYTMWPKWINAETGTRSDVPHNMIYPLKDTRPNLHFLTGVLVKHVMLNEENRATGVAYALNPLFHPDGPRGTCNVRGTRLVLVPAGALGSPGILERSGIGAEDVLERIGVKQRVDLPGVGENYQDHNSLFIRYIAADEAQSLDAIFRNEDGAIESTAAEFGITRKELSMHNSVDAGIKWRPKLSELAELGPEFQEYWDSYFADAPDKPALSMLICSACVLELLDCQNAHHKLRSYSFIGNSVMVPPRKYFTFCTFTTYPLARGHVHITHADDVSAPVDFAPGHFESKADVRPLTWAYKFTGEVARRMPHFRGEPHMLHPAFAPGGPASIIEHADGHIAFDTPRIVYSEDDERALEAFAFAKADVMWHSSRKEGGVVDARLNV
ncbi:alcohol oxidase [Lactarius tabidus]